jgi:hypothetical protein
MVSRRASAGTSEIKIALGNIATKAAELVNNPAVSPKMNAE